MKDIRSCAVEAMIRERKKKPVPVWTTKNGKQIPINEMSDLHLANTIAMLNRKMDITEMFDDTLFTYDDEWLNILETEQERRKNEHT